MPEPAPVTRATLAFRSNNIVGDLLFRAARQP
jgi:hypothetical protein